jgi:GDP-4-dehydro-6-deoxy-D-mannose reductase
MNGAAQVFDSALTVPAGPILITGAKGFVGRHVCAALAAEVPEIEIVTTRANITNAAEISALVKRVRPARCLHLAAVAALAEARQSPVLAWAVNLHGTLNLAAALRQHAPDCLMVYASSADIYGASFRDGRALDEAAPLAPLNTYAATKAAADLALGALAAETGLRVLRLRPFNHTGAGQSDAFVVPAFARQIARIEAGLAPPVIAVGALDTERDFLDVRDVARAYVAALLRGGNIPSGAILNIASGTPRRISDVLHDLLSLVTVEVHIEQDCSRLRPSDIPHTAGNAGRAADLLNWHPTIDWTETLGTVLNDWRRRVSEAGNIDA